MKEYVLFECDKLFYCSIYITVMGKMFQQYNSPICLSSEAATHMLQINVQNSSSSSDEYCIHGEPDLERAMKRTDLSPQQLKLIWTTWHNHSDLKMKDLYRSSVFYQNLAAQNNGNATLAIKINNLYIE